MSGRVFNVKLDTSLGEAVSIQATYELNQIPQAVINLAVGGRNHPGSDGGNPTKIGGDKRGKVWIKLQQPDSVELFDGYFQGVGAARNTTAVNKAFVAHWLDDLKSFSSANSQHTPSKLWNYSDPMVKEDGIVVPEMYSRSPNVRTCAIKILSTATSGAESGISAAGSNKLALAAMQRISGDLTIRSEGAEEIMLALSRMINAELLDTYTGGTLWDALVRLGDAMLYVVAPSPYGVTLLPFVPARPIGKSRRIKPGELAGVESGRVRGDSVGGVIVLSVNSQPTGAGDATAPIVTNRVIYRGGDGPFVPIELPPWLEAHQAEGYRAAASSSPGVFRFQGRRGNDVQASNAETPPEVPSPEKNGQYEKTRLSLAQAWAQLGFIHSALVNNTATLTLGIDTDVVPGQTLEFVMPGDKGKSEGVLSGLVNKVQYDIDAENHGAVTLVSLTHVHDGRYDDVITQSGGNLLYGGL